MSYSINELRLVKEFHVPENREGQLPLILFASQTHANCEYLLMCQHITKTPQICRVFTEGPPSILVQNAQVGGIKRKITRLSWDLEDGLLSEFQGDISTKLRQDSLIRNYIEKGKAGDVFMAGAQHLMKSDQAKRLWRAIQAHNIWTVIFTQ